MCVYIYICIYVNTHNYIWPICPFRETTMTTCIIIIIIGARYANVHNVKMSIPFGRQCCQHAS